MPRHSRHSLTRQLFVSLILIITTPVFSRHAAAQISCIRCEPQTYPRLTVVPHLAFGFERDTVAREAYIPLKVGIAAEYSLHPRADWPQESVPIGASFRAESASDMHAALGGPRIAWRSDLQGSPLEVYAEFLAGHATRDIVMGTTSRSSGGSMTEFATGLDLPAGKLLHLRIEYSYGAVHGGARARPQGLTFGVSWYLR